MFPRGLAEGWGVETNTPLFLPRPQRPPPPPTPHPPPPPPRKLAPRLYGGVRRGLILL